MKMMGPCTLVPVMVGMLAALIGCSGAGGGAAVSAAGLETEDDKTLYALGHTMGSNIKGFGLTSEEIEIVKIGLTDAVTGAEAQVDSQDYGPKIQAFAQARTTLQAALAKERARAYLAEAGGEEGAVTTPSGLVYLAILEGTGAAPKPTDNVSVHYRGALEDGTEFDSSYTRNQPAQFSLNKVIACWTEGLQLMKVGGAAKFICPSDIGYGDAGRPPVIPPGATLVFEVELLEIVAQ